MDVISNIPRAVQMVRDAYDTYQTGKQVKLGQYNGTAGMKQVGHYNSKTGKRLAIYHGTA